MKKHIFLILFLLTLCFQVKAESIDSMNSFKMNRIEKMCSSFSRELGMPQSDSIKWKKLADQAFSSTKIAAEFSYEGLKNSILLENIGLSLKTKDIIDSPEYDEALTNCFGEKNKNAKKWRAFTLLIILSDVTGQTIGYVGTYWILPSKIFKGLDLLIKSSRLANAHNMVKALTFLKKAIPIASTALTGYIAIKTFNVSSLEDRFTETSRKNKEDIHEISSEFLEKIGQEIKSEFLKKDRDDKKIKMLVELYNDELKSQLEAIN